MEVSAANLGVDYTAGRSMRLTASRNHLRKRFNKHLGRRTKLMRLARGSKKAAQATIADVHSKEQLQQAGEGNPRSYVLQTKMGQWSARFNGQ